MQYLFIGSGAFAAQVLSYLTPPPTLIITKPNAFGGRGMKTALPSPVKIAAQKRAIPFVEVDSAPELNSVLIQHKMLLGVLADFGMIIPEELLTIPEYGIWNIHPSLLPRYRGSSPIQTALLNGDTTTGVTIIQIDRKLDHGPLLAQETVAIDHDDTTPTLSEKLARVGAGLIMSLSNNTPGVLGMLVPQQHTAATYTKRITKKDGYIPLEKLRPYLLPIFTKYNLLHLLPDAPTTLGVDSQQLDRMLRALQPWPGVWTTAKNGKMIKLLSPHAVQIEGKIYSTSMI